MAEVEAYADAHTPEDQKIATLSDAEADALAELV
jgi:hypothetical protein